MMAHLISQNHDGVPSYFSPASGRAHAAAGSWTANADNALAFARPSDALVYLEYHLGHLAPMCSVVPMEVAP